MPRFVLLIIAALTACLSSVTFAVDNRLTAEEEQAGWQLLFNGRDHTGWTCNNGEPIATPVEDGSLLPFESGGYIIIYEKKQFGDFILKCDVKWEADRCNSGVFFRVEDPENPVHTGFEAQVESDTGTGKGKFGAIYDLAPTKVFAGNKTGEWNTLEITCRGPLITVKLNSKEVSSMDCDQFDVPGYCPDGEKHKYNLDGKPRAVKDFARKGYVGLQDHGQKVWYKNVKLLELSQGKN
jgi:hypothetical protein